MCNVWSWMRVQIRCGNGIRDWQFQGWYRTCTTLELDVGPRAECEKCKLHVPGGNRKIRSWTQTDRRTRGCQVRMSIMRFPTKDVAYHSRCSPHPSLPTMCPWTTTAFITGLGGCGEQTDDDVSEIINAPTRGRRCYAARSSIHPRPSGTPLLQEAM